MPCRFQNRIWRWHGTWHQLSTSLQRCRPWASCHRFPVEPVSDNHGHSQRTIAPTSHLHHCYAIAVVIKTKNCHQMALNRWNVWGQHHNVENEKENTLWSEERISRTKTDLQDANMSIDGTRMLDDNAWRFCIWTLCYRSAKIDQWLSITKKQKPHDENIHLDSLKPCTSLLFIYHVNQEKLYNMEKRSDARSDNLKSASKTKTCWRNYDMIVV